MSEFEGPKSTLDKMYLEYSNLTTAKTRKELQLEKERDEALRDRDSAQAAEIELLDALKYCRDKLTESDVDWNRESVDVTIGEARSHE